MVCNIKIYFELFTTYSLLMPTATTIDGVIAELDRILQLAEESGNRLGYFPALYRKVTLRVKEGIAAGHFDDGPRMERLDVLFANRYLEAYDQFHAGRPVSRCWRLAFESAASWSPVVLQHLLLGMNAHINLDLGIAAAQTVSAEELPSLENDFKRINTLLNDLIDGVQEELAAVWPWLKWIDFFAGKRDEFLAGIGIDLSRKKAWKVAQRIAATPEAERENAIAELDRRVHRFGKLVLRPPFPGLWLFFLAVRLGERKSVPEIIKLLR